MSHTTQGGRENQGGSRLSRTLETVGRTDRDFKGDIPELGVLGIPLEASNLNNGKTYYQFTAKLMNYTARTMNNGDRLKTLVEELHDPVPDYMLLQPVPPKKKRMSKREKEPKKAKEKRLALKAAARKKGKKSGEFSEEEAFESDVLDSGSESDNSDIEYDAEELFNNEKHIWGLRMKKFVDGIEELEANARKLFSLIMGQCTNAMQERLKTRQDFEVKKKLSDSLWLLESLKEIMTGVQDTAHPYMLAVTKLKEFAMCIQKSGETTEEYKERCVAALQELKVAIGPNVLKNIDVGDGKKGEDVEDRFMAAYMLSNADRVRHGDRVSDLEKDYEVGQDNIPDKPSKAFEILVSTEERLRREHQRYNRSRNARDVSFYQGGGGVQGPRRQWPEGEERVPGSDGTLQIIQCHRCNKWGHKSFVCPTLARTSEQSEGGQQVSREQVHNSFLFNTVHADACIKDSRYFIDTAASHPTTKDSNNATNRKSLSSSDFLYAICNAGNIIFDCTHVLDFIPLTAYHNPQSVANVLAAHEIDKIPGAHVFHDGSKDPHDYVIFEEGRVMKFIRCNEGLYYYDVDKPEEHEFRKSDFVKDVN